MEYNYWMSEASDCKDCLDNAFASKNAKEVLYYRGKYLYALKQAYKVNAAGMVPASVSNGKYAVKLVDEIKTELVNHENQLKLCTKANKLNSHISRPTISTELGLKLRRLATHISRLDYAANNTEKDVVKRDIRNSSLSLGASALKALPMSIVKTASMVVPLGIAVVAKPCAFVLEAIKTFAGVTDGPYNDNIISNLSVGLQKVVRELTSFAYERVGRI